MKYQCNTCGRIYDEKEYAAICHPNITELDDISEPTQQSVQPDWLTRPPNLCRVHNIQYSGIACPVCMSMARDMRR